MALLFSEVTLYPEKESENERTTTFLVSGIPTDAYDLEEYSAYQKYLDSMEAGEGIIVLADIYTYGEGKKCNATPEEIAYLSMRLERDPLFLEKHCSFFEETDILIPYSPDIEDTYRRMEIS